MNTLTPGSPPKLMIPETLQETIVGGGGPRRAVLARWGLGLPYFALAFGFFLASINAVCASTILARANDASFQP